MLTSNEQVWSGKTGLFHPNWYHKRVDFMRSMNAIGRAETAPIIRRGKGWTRRMPPFQHGFQAQTATLRPSRWAMIFLFLFWIVNWMGESFWFFPIDTWASKAIIRHTLQHGTNVNACSFRIDRFPVTIQLYHNVSRFLCLLVPQRRTLDVLAELLIPVGRIVSFCSAPSVLVFCAGQALV